jgi:hypothetical protein
MKTKNSREYWKYYSNLECSQIEWFDKNTLDLYLDIKEEEIYQLFDDTNSQIVAENNQEPKKNLDSSDIMTNTLIDKTSLVQSTLHDILQQNWYHDIQFNSLWKSYFQQQNDLVDWLRTLLDKEIDWIDYKTGVSLWNDIHPTDLIEERKKLTNKRDKLIRFSCLLKKYTW